MGSNLNGNWNESQENNYYGPKSNQANGKDKNKYHGHNHANSNNEEKERDKKGNNMKHGYPNNNKYNNTKNNQYQYNQFNQDYYNQNVPMVEEDEKVYEEEQMQCQKQMNIQLLLRRQKHYNNTFKNCYVTFKEYIKNPSQINKGNFIWNLDGCCSMVSLWKKDYPEYEPQFSKEFKKDAVKQEIKALIKKIGKNDENTRLFNKFYQLLDNKEQNMEKDEDVLNYFPQAQSNQNNVISNANNLIDIKRKIDQETEKEEFYGFRDYEVDDKIKHLRNKF